MHGRILNVADYALPERGAQVVVVEIAGGVFQQETKAIFLDSTIRDRLDGILFAAPDALCALVGGLYQESLKLSPFAISGMVSCSSLAAAEATQATVQGTHPEFRLGSE